jgi:CRISPR-associated endonuclease/helicase Cas3
MGELLSHPNKHFEDHVREIIEIGKTLVETFGPENKEKKEKYLKIIKFLAFFHDLGKLTEENQQAIKKNLKKLPHEHSKYGEIVFNIFWNSLKNSKENDIAMIVSFIIKHHHSDFRDFIEKSENLLSVNEKDKERIKEILLQINSLTKKLESIFSETEIDQLTKCIDIDINSLLHYVKRKEDNKPIEVMGIVSLETFVDIIFISSIFFIADRISASGISYNRIKEEINNICDPKIFSDLLRKFEIYVEEKLTAIDEINHKRKEYYEKTINTLTDKFNDTTRIYKIFLPTGIGKTYIGVRVALEISSKYNIPLVYSLPFINIIDQVYDRLSEIFNNKDTKIVKKLHHLTILERGDEYSPFREIINFEFSPILITTFVQVFHSLFAVERDFLLRLPLLLNSCIIIDEVQALDPEKFYTPLEELIRTLSKMGFRIRMIIMSATMPPLFQNNKDDFAIEITSEFRDECYELFNRYRIKIVSKEMDLEEYQNILQSKLFEEYADKNSVGIICNKVDEAKKIFMFLKNFLGDGEYFINDKMLKYCEEAFCQIEEMGLNFSQDEIKVIRELGDCILHLLKEEERGCIGYYSREHKTLLIYLAANLIDASKINRVRFLHTIMKKIKENNFCFPINIEGKEINRLIVVSTQVIEAGVDFDFEIVFRSFAPFESIIQTAGRVNRNNKWRSCGVMEVYKIVMNGIPTFNPIYPQFLIDKTENLFADKDVTEILEKDVLKLVKNYLKIFEYMKKEEFVKYLKFIQFGEINKNFRIIEFIYGSFNFVLDSDSGEIFNRIEKIRELIKNEDYRKKKFIYKRIIPFVYFLQAKTYLKKDGLIKLLELIERGNVKVYSTSTIKRDRNGLLKDLLMTSLLFVTEKSVYDLFTGFNFVGDDVIYIL